MALTEQSKQNFFKVKSLVDSGQSVVEASKTIGKNYGSWYYDIEKRLSKGDKKSIPRKPRVIDLSQTLTSTAHKTTRKNVMLLIGPVDELINFTKGLN